MKWKFNIRDPKTRNILIIVFLGILGVVGWVQLIYIEKNKECGALQTKLAEKQKELNSILALKPQLHRLEMEIAAAQHKLDSLKSIFPDQKEVPKLIREITGVARVTSIYTTKFTPSADVEKEYYIENGYDIAVSGAYHDLARFFSFLAKMPLIINLSNVSIRTSPRLEESKKLSEERGTTISTVNASFRMTTFSSKK
jgi:type IV pilus assembly protein PilO